MAFNSMRRGGETKTPQLVTVYGQFTLNGAAAPTVPGGPQNVGIASITRTGVGVYNVVLNEVGEWDVALSCWLNNGGTTQALSAWVQSYTKATKTIVINIGNVTTITGTGAMTLNDTAAGLVYCEFTFSDADYKA